MFFGGIVLNAMDEISSVCDKAQLDKERIEKEWMDTYNYPRKKKKRVRIELQVDYNIACWALEETDFEIFKV